MEDEKKPVEIIFAPGCFDEFEGTQEELDALVEEIRQSFSEEGDTIENSSAVSIKDLVESLSDEELLEVEEQISLLSKKNRKLH